MVMLRRLPAWSRALAAAAVVAAGAWGLLTENAVNALLRALGGG